MSVLPLMSDLPLSEARTEFVRLAVVLAGR